MLLNINIKSFTHVDFHEALFSLYIIHTKKHEYILAGPWVPKGFGTELTISLFFVTRVFKKGSLRISNSTYPSGIT